MPTLPYRRRQPAHVAATDESRRKATRLFVLAGVLFAIGMCLILFAPIMLALDRKDILRAIGAYSSSRGSTRLLAMIGILGICTCGLAIRMFNAACYHRSGFEHRRFDQT